MALSSKRPKNHEVENEMIRAPAKSGEPPRPATEPAKPGAARPEKDQRPD